MHKVTQHIDDRAINWQRPCVPPPLQWHPGTLISLWAQPLTLGTQLDLWFNKQMISPFHSIARSAKDSYCISVAKREGQRETWVWKVQVWVSPAPCHWVTALYKPAQCSRWERGRRRQPTGSLVRVALHQNFRWSDMEGLKKNGNVSQVADGLKCLPWPSVVKRHFLGWERRTCHWWWLRKCARSAPERRR